MNLWRKSIVGPQFNNIKDRYPEMYYLFHDEGKNTWSVIRYAQEDGLSWRIGMRDVQTLREGTAKASDMELYRSAQDLSR